MPGRPRAPAHPATLRLPVSTALKTALELEAWECQLNLNDYVRGLLERRGRWMRTVGAGRVKYDIQAVIPRVGGGQET
jgi:hypothetical protein